MDLLGLLTKNNLISLVMPFLLHIICHMISLLPKCESKEPAFSKNRPILSIHQNVRMFVCLSVCLSHFLTPLNNLFAPTSQSLMSKLFKYKESLGKSNRKKFSQIWNFLLKIVFICSPHLHIFLPPLPEVQSPNFLDFWNPLGKKIERWGLRSTNFCS